MLRTYVIVKKEMLYTKKTKYFSIYIYIYKLFLSVPKSLVSNHNNSSHCSNANTRPNIISSFKPAQNIES